jgi:MYXO-CTERM domain-containing protein
LDTTVWEGGSAGSFASGSGWSFLTAPNKNIKVFIDPTVSATITGPLVNTDVKQLTVGGDGTGNNGIATLSLSGGTINVLGDAGQFTTINAQGVLTGDGTINGAVNNLGTVNATNLGFSGVVTNAGTVNVTRMTVSGGLTNLGTLTGNGQLNTNLSNRAGGLLRVGAGQLLKLSGSVHTNAGSVEVRGGGELQVTGGFTNASGGSVLADSAIVRFNSPLFNTLGSRVSLANATAYFNSGLINNGQLQATFGTNSVFGAVTISPGSPGGKIILSGNSNNTFYDAVDVNRTGELRVSSGSTAVFFGQVTQRTGSLFTGTGTKFYEGGLAIGASPGLGVDGGDVSFGAGNVYAVDIGGTAACTAECAINSALKDISFDKYVVAGHFALGGALKLDSWNGFVAQAGQRFDLLDWGSVSGSFSSIDASGLLLAAGTALDTSQLYTSGVISIMATQAVPEPQPWALMLAALGIFGATRRRRILQCLVER